MKKIIFLKAIALLGMIVAMIYSFFDYLATGPLAFLFGIAYLLGALITEFSIKKDWEKRENMMGAAVSIIVIAVCTPSVVENFLGELNHLAMVSITIAMIIFLMIFVSLPSVERWAKKIEENIRKKDIIKERKR